MKILFTASEAWPLVKTGGLGDVAHGLTHALRERRHDVRLLLPAHPDAVAGLEGRIRRHALTLDQRPFTLIEGRLPGTRVTTWLLDDPPLFARAGNPYTTEDGDPWPDNARRYHRLSRVAAALAAGELLPWQAAVLHAHDWQTALAPFLLQRRPVPARPLSSPFTTWPTAASSRGDPHPPRATAGGVDARRPGVPRPARLYQGRPGLRRCHHHRQPHLRPGDPDPGLRLRPDGLLRHRSGVLHGIVNGIDTTVWNPAADPTWRPATGNPTPRPGPPTAPPLPNGSASTAIPARGAARCSASSGGWWNRRVST